VPFSSPNIDNVKSRLYDSIKVCHSPLERSTSACSQDLVS
jgi:hypothetical protein